MPGLKLAEGDRRTDRRTDEERKRWKTALFVETEYLRVLGSGAHSGTTELRQGRNQPSGPEVVCLADELASARCHNEKPLCA